MDNYKVWADDYGYNKKVNAEINLLLKEKKVAGCSILATHIGDKIIVSDLGKNVFVGLHTNLVEGIPVSDSAEVSSLVDKKGRFYPLWIFVIRIFLGIVKTKDLRKEIEAQYKKLINMGIKITHIDSHQHIHSLGLVDSSVRKIADKYNLTLRSYGDVKAFTVRAKLTITLLRGVSYLTHPFCRFPEGWMKNDSSWHFMSWEAPRFNKMINNIKNNDFLVVHPGRNCDRCGKINY